MIWYIVCAFAGYALSVMTWPTLRYWAMGAEEEVIALRNRIRVIEAKAKQFTGS